MSLKHEQVPVAGVEDAQRRVVGKAAGEAGGSESGELPASSAWLLLRDHPSTCPLPLSWPALPPPPSTPPSTPPPPPPSPSRDRPHLSPWSPRPRRGRCGPLGVRRFWLPGLRLWAPARCHPRQDQRPGRGGGGEGGGVQGLGRGDAHAGNSLGPAAARHHQGHCEATLTDIAPPNAMSTICSQLCFQTTKRSAHYCLIREPMVIPGASEKVKNLPWAFILPYEGECS
ncbi:splicing factor, proline- and glutamine-rich-like [Balaenoptera ricei]|uniref:splicing factor, proline- and glutamine-rich-like n=1 Tax=Balaenoptera ricei TaxID=2746895 RepID=UPI0028BEA0CF|nr:splicing factor, proline- and glutamine-rich-like [Balaenoptera ricei]